MQKWEEEDRSGRGERKVEAEGTVAIEKH